MMYSVTDVSGINRIREKVLANAAHALAGMIALRRPSERRVDQAGARPDDVRRHHALRAGGHQAAGGATTTAWCSTPPASAASRWRSWPTPGLLAGVIDVTTTEIADEIVGGVLTAGPDAHGRLRAASVPYVGSLRRARHGEFLGLGTRCPRASSGRRLHRHNPQRDADAHHGRGERARSARFIADKLNRMRRAGALPDPGRRRVGARQARRRRSGIPAADRALFDAIASELPRRRRPRSCCACRSTSTTRRSPTRWSPTSARSTRARDGAHGNRIAARTTILKKLPRARCARGEPIIGGGAGTGLSAKCEEAGGIDLIVIYNSGRYRMAGRGSLAGLMAYGNANEIVLDMAREVLPVVKNTPVLAGVNGTDPFLIARRVPAAAGRPGLLRHPELPDRRPDRRHDPRQARGDRHGLRRWKSR